MSCGDKPLRHSSLKRRVNSDMDKDKRKLDDDVQSFILSGNLNLQACDVDVSCDEEEFEDVFEDCVEELDEENINVDDIVLAEEILLQTFGVNCCVKKFIHLLVSQKLSPSDMAVQSLVYKIQSLLGGPKSVRFQSSWGMFWAGIRNLTKTRGLVGFQEHFCIPSRLSKFKDMILKMCTMSKEMLGKPGLQKENVSLFIRGKQSEIYGKPLCLSLSLDGKKIAVTGDGREDMGGLGDGETNVEKDENYENCKKEILGLVDGNDKKKLFSLYDHMSQTGKSIALNISVIGKLITTNNKKLQNNPRLNKYLFVLNRKLMSGKELLDSLNSIQSKIIKLIAAKRNCSNMTPPENGACNVRNQPNYFRLSSLCHEDEIMNLKVVKSVQNAANVMETSTSNLGEKLSRPLKEIPRESETFRSIFNQLFLTADIVHKASGLGKIHPLKDMQSFYEKSHSSLSSFRNSGPLRSSLTALATFFSNFAPMTFGGNLRVHEAGIFSENDVSSTPDVIVVDKDNNIVYSVVFVAVEDNSFDITEEMLSLAIMTAHSCNAVKGCLVLLHSEISCTVFSVPNNVKLCDDFKTLIFSYTRASKNIARRNVQTSQQIDGVRTQLAHLMDGVSTLGCYPLVSGINSSKDLPCLILTEGNFLKPHSTNMERSERINIEYLKQDIDKLLDEDRRFESKNAREIIAVNLSDISGIKSKFPHTILAGAFLSAASLKVVAKDVIKETESLVNSLGAVVVNIGVDGESLGLVTNLPNGAPGTLMSLAKYVFRKLQMLSKQELANFCMKNRSIIILEHAVEISEDFIEESDEIVFNEEMDVDFQINNTVAAESNKVLESELLTLEDVENLLISDNDAYSKEREKDCKKLKKVELKLACLRFLLPKVRKIWLLKTMGIEGFKIFLKDNETFYIPNTVFFQPKKGFYQTVTFDAAHLSNLLRESAAKNRLINLGLTLQSLENLSNIKGFEYLKKILKLKNQSSLEFDPMNQKSSALLFSSRTEEGLRRIKDVNGAECCRLLREGIIEGLDESGIPAEKRMQQILNLKYFLDAKIVVLDRFHKKDKSCITSELLQMLHTSLDSHVTTYANLDKFSTRRKSTGTVEQFFSQITLMCEGGSKLHCREISDILSRVMLTNALRLLPNSVKGFSFLAGLKIHMTSYKSDAFENDEDLDVVYPELHEKGDIHPKDSLFDKKRGKPRSKQARKVDEMIPVSGSSVVFDGNVRKYHKRF